MKHPFRHMLLTLKLTQAQVALLLAVEGLEFTQDDYALFFMIGNIIHTFDNPTYKQVYGALGASLRFYRKLLDKLPEGELRTGCEREWAKLIENYGDLLEVKNVG